MIGGAVETVAKVRISVAYDSGFVRSLVFSHSTNGIEHVLHTLYLLLSKLNL